MYIKIRIFATLCFALLDLPITFLLLSCGNGFSHILQLLETFDFRTSLVDASAFSLARSCIFIGGVIGVYLNSIEGPKRCKAVQKIVPAVSYLSICYFCIKILICAENDSSEFQTDVWFWMLFAWTVIGSAIFLFQWNTLVYCLFNSEAIHTLNVIDETNSLIPGTSADLNASKYYLLIY